ncbi:MAG: DUF3284 domain-containing protein [Lachnospiraceae bacterium]|nr:DUF3284 domain-containing protein [Lachnospiraceae bacterium]
MKIIRTLKITSDEFYDYLENDLLETANQTRSSGKVRFTRSNIRPGFKVSRETGQAYSRIDLMVREYVRGKVYAGTTKSVADTIDFSYTTEVREDGLCVVFEQRMHNYEAKKMNKFTRAWSDITYLRRMSNQLYDIQAKIIRVRNGEEEPKPLRPLGYETAKNVAEKVNEKHMSDKKAQKKAEKEKLKEVVVSVELAPDDPKAIKAAKRKEREARAQNQK